MNILFLLKSLNTGGLEVVTAVLANKFALEGHGVWIFSFLEGTKAIAHRLDKQVKLVTGKEYKANRENVTVLREMVKGNQIDVIINQWGLPLVPIRTARKAIKGLNIRIISVYHNAPSFNGRTQSVDIKLMRCENPLKRLKLKGQRWLYKKVTSLAMRYIYTKSDLFLVLSECYKEEFQKFTRAKNTCKLKVMTNPVTVDNKSFIYNYEDKRKEIIYVGRLDFVQKRVYRVIDTWNYLEEKFPDWQLTIVGDGEDRKNLEEHVRALGLKKVSFKGFHPPVEYYKRASILVLTSDFEGFPLVLAEAMSFGVVPVVYHSFAAAGDIIENGNDGILIPYSLQRFPAENMANTAASLMKDHEKRQRMAEAAIKKSKQFGIDAIYKQWMRLLTQNK